MGFLDAFKRGGSAFQQTTGTPGGYDDEGEVDAFSNTGYTPAAFGNAGPATSNVQGNLDAANGEDEQDLMLSDATPPAPTQPVQPQAAPARVQQPGQEAQRQTPIRDAIQNRRRPLMNLLSGRLGGGQQRGNQQRQKSEAMGKINDYRQRAAGGDALSAMALSMQLGGKFMDGDLQKNAYRGFNRNKEAWATAIGQMDHLRSPADVKNWADNLLAATDGAVDVRHMVGEQMNVAKVPQVKQMLKSFAQAAGDFGKNEDFAGKAETAELGRMKKLKDLGQIKEIEVNGKKQPHQWDTEQGKWVPFEGEQQKLWRAMISNEDVARTEAVNMGSGTVNALKEKFKLPDGRMALRADISKAKHRKMWDRAAVTSKRNSFAAQHKPYKSINKAFDMTKKVMADFERTGKLSASNSAFLGKFMQQMVEPGLQVTEGEVRVVRGEGSTMPADIKLWGAYLSGEGMTLDMMRDVMSTAESIHSAAALREDGLLRSTIRDAVRANHGPKDVLDFVPAKMFKGDRFADYKGILSSEQAEWEADKEKMGNYISLNDAADDKYFDTHGNPERMERGENSPPSPAASEAAQPQATEASAFPDDGGLDLIDIPNSKNGTSAEIAEATIRRAEHEKWQLQDTARANAADGALARDGDNASVQNASVQQPEAQQRPHVQQTYTPGGGSAAQETAKASAAIGAHGYFEKMGGVESGNKNVANAAGASSAQGYFQMTKATAEAYDLKGGAMKYSYPRQLEAITRFTQDNIKALNKAGIAVDHGSLYAMHFMGRGGGVALMKAANATPGANAATMFRAAAGANPNIFYKHGDKDTPRSVAEVRALLTSKMGGKPGKAMPAQFDPKVHAEPYQELQEGTQSALPAIGGGDGLPPSPSSPEQEPAPNPYAVAPGLAGGPLKASYEDRAPKPPEKKRSPEALGREAAISGMASFGEGVKQGLTLGWGDEMGAYVRSFIGGGEYETLLAENRQYLEDAGNANPKSFMGGEVTGGIATAAVPGTLVAKGAMKGGQLATQGFMKATGAAATEGAVMGAGQGEGSGKFMGAVTGAGIGALVGASFFGLVQKALPGLIKIGNRTTREVTDAALAGSRSARRELIDKGFSDQAIDRAIDAREFGIKLERSQATQNPAEAMSLQTARNVPNAPGAEQARQFDMAQRQQVSEAVGGMGDVAASGGKKMVPGAEGIGDAVTEQAADEVRNTFAKRASKMHKAATKAYDDLDLKGTRVSPQSVSQIGKNIRKALGQGDVAVSKKLTPNAHEALQYMDELATMAKGKGITEVSLKKLRSVQEKLNALTPGFNSEAKRDRRALAHIHKEFNSQLEEVVSNALIRGNPEELAKLKNANKLFGDYAKLARPKNATDAQNKIAQMINDRSMTAKDVSDLLWNQSQMGMKKGSQAMALQLKKSLGKDSKAFNKFRQATLMRAFYDVKTGAERSPSQIKTSLQQLLNQGVTKVAFDEPERKLISKFAKVLETLAPPANTTNFSRSGWIREAMHVASRAPGGGAISVMGHKLLDVFAAAGDAKVVTDILETPLKETLDSPLAGIPSAFSGAVRRPTTDQALDGLPEAYSSKE